jgi:hypothetical protein
MDLVEQYRVINESFSKKLVFRLGIEAGFFSEYNNMILAMAYCLKHKIQFSLYSKNAWFSKVGWKEFFEIFCREETSEIHSTINTRLLEPSGRIWLKPKTILYKRFSGINYLTYDLWFKFHNRELEQETFYIDEIGINGDLRSTCGVLTDITWRYNLDTHKAVEQLIKSVKLPDEYLGFHIRCGDKLQETSLYPVRCYFEQIASRSVCRNAFISTDDYRIYETIRKEYPEWTIYTLCQKDEQGYYQKEFMKKDPSEIREQYLRLFASTDILLKSKLLIGTFTSNVGMYLGMRMEPEKCLGVDNTTWRIW